jgi:hypothetical protein
MKTITIIIEIIKAIIGRFKKKPQQAEQRKFDDEDKAKELLRQFRDIKQEILNEGAKDLYAMVHNLDRSAILARLLQLECKRDRIAADYESITGHPPE